MRKLLFVMILCIGFNLIHGINPSDDEKKQALNLVIRTEFTRNSTAYRLRTPRYVICVRAIKTETIGEEVTGHKVHNNGIIEPLSKEKALSYFRAFNDSCIR